MHSPKFLYGGSNPKRPRMKKARICNKKENSKCNIASDDVWDCLKYENHVSTCRGYPWNKGLGLGNVPQAIAIT